MQKAPGLIDRKKRICSFGLALICTVSYGVSGLAASNTAVDNVPAAEALSEYANNEIFVSYADGSTAVLTYGSKADLATALAALAEDPSVSLFQPNYSYTSTALTTSDALAAQQWALSNDGSFVMEEQKNSFPVYDTPFGTPSAPGRWMMPGFSGISRMSAARYTAASQTTAVAGIDIHAETAWDLYNGGSREVIVALIDTGVDYTHEDLQNAIWVNEDEIPNNGVDDDGNGYIDDVYGWNFFSGNNGVYVSADEDSHGTHGAGTIAASSNNGIGIAGVTDSENVSVMTLKALGGKDGSGSTASIIQAIQYAEANGASICNLSLGTTNNDRALYQVMANSSMLFVVAAGNDGANTDSSPCYPASYDLDNIISVANLNYDGTMHKSSNYGMTSVDLAAPGSYILSTTPGNAYSYMTGTSMAAPMVTAAAAMVYSHYADITLRDVKEIILTSVAPLSSLSGVVATSGMLDLGAAMAFDISTLSGKTWEPAAPDTGSAPIIEARQTIWHGKTYLSVTVKDADQDLSFLAYAVGSVAADAFRNGTAGETFSLNQNGTAVFSIFSIMTLTLYACDSAGNETVKTVEVISNTTPAPPQWPGTGRIFR